MKKIGMWLLIAALCALPIMLSGCGGFIEKPTAYINASPTSGNAPLTVSFTGGTDATGDVSYQWTFGDGAIGSGQYATYTYQNPGPYTATLVVSNKNGCCGSRVSEPASVIIAVSEQPVPWIASIDIDGLPACPKEYVSFSAKVENDAYVTGYYWEFSESSTGDLVHSWTGKTVSFMFNDPGNYTASLTITDNKGSWYTSQSGFTINDCCDKCPPPPCSDPCPGPCDKSYLERLDPEKACVNAYADFTIEAFLNDWPCYDPCGATSGIDVQGIKPCPRPGHDPCPGNCDNVRVVWTFYRECGCGQEPVIGDDYEIISLSGEFDQIIIVEFFKAGDWTVTASLYNGSVLMGDPVSGQYMVKYQ